MRLRSLLVMSLCLGAGCARGRERANDVSALAQELTLPISPDAVIVGVHREPEGDGFLRAKLRMTHAAWQQLRTAAGLSGDSMSNGPGGLGDDDGWWDPNQAKLLRTGQVQPKPGTYLHLGVAQGEAKQLVVYVVQHGT